MPGQQTKAMSMPVVIASDQTIAVSSTPATLGQAAMAASAPVAIASDQSAVKIDAVGASYALVITSNTITRPTDTNAYALGDLVANSTTAGSVTPFTFANAASITAGVGRIDRIRILKSTTTTANALFRVHIYNAAPTSLANGDNGAWSTANAGYIGAFDVNCDKAFTDGAHGVGVPLIGGSLMFKIASGTTLYALLEARAAYAPGNAETFTLIAETYRF